MEQLIESVKTIAKDEYDRAAAVYGRQHASQHEAYAVILEEFQETCEDVTTLGNLIADDFWKNVRTNNLDGNATVAKQIYDAAIFSACEAIQVAAMAYKASQGYRDRR